MSKIGDVLDHLQTYGWIDGKQIQKLTGTTSVRDYIYELKKSGRVRVITHRITPTYTRWIRTSRNINRTLT